MNFHVQKYIQNKQEFLIGTMTARQIIDNSKVLIYNKDEGGYQREPNDLHINKISKYILDNNNFILPTAIILGIDKELLISEEIVTNFYQVTLREQNKFRIVDGQHRIEGIKKSLLINNDNENFIFPIIIILTDPKRRSIELEVFTDINSKAKRINTDLAQLAKHDYELIENEIKSDEINNHIAIKTAFKLKENKSSVWSNAIKFDIQTDFNIGIIGVTMFSSSIQRIVEKYKKERGLNVNNNKNIIKECDLLADEIAIFLNNVWTKIIKKKWESAFTENYLINSYGESVLTYYDSKYYLQKGIGTKSINNFIGEILDVNSIENSFIKIENHITNSPIKSEDWIVGGNFAGYNSEAGFKKIKDLLSN